MADQPAVLDPKTGQPSAQPPKPDEKPKELSKEAKDGLAKFAHSFLPEKFEAPKTETPEEKAAREKAEKDKRTAKPKPAPPRKPTPPAPPTVDQIAEAAARGVASVLQPKNEEPKPDAGVATFEFSDADKQTIRVLEHMEKIDPSKKGVSDKWKKAKVELQKYAEQWEKEHPGQEFDAEAEEHNPWFDANEPKYEQNEFDRAKWRLEDDADREKERREFNERLSVFERKAKLQEAQPEIFKAQTQPAQLLWTAMGADFKGLITNDGKINMEKAVELKKADPLTFPTRMASANALNMEVAELYKVMNGLADYDEKNVIHVAIGNFAAEEEKRLAAKPIEDRVNADGKDFLPAAEYYRLPAKKREEYWTFSVHDVAALRAANLADYTTKLIAAREKEHEEWAQARGFSRGTKTPTQPTPPKVEDEPLPEATDDKPLSPSTSQDSRLSASRKATGAGAPSTSYSFFQRQLGKK